MDDFECLKRDGMNAVDPVASAPRQSTATFLDAPPKLMKPTSGQLICPNPNCGNIGMPKNRSYLMLLLPASRDLLLHAQKRI
jgi:hypothetical protein